MNPWKVIPFLAATAILTLAACAPTGAEVPAAATTVATKVAGTQIEITVAGTETTAPTVKTVEDPVLGTILVDEKGMTLYRFTNDQANVSNCYDQCAENWPPLVATDQPALEPGVEGMLGTTTRNDGSMQVTYNGMPLYYFVRDTQPGDAEGHGLNGVWFVVQPGM